jgi:hypothetical protein
LLPGGANRFTGGELHPPKSSAFRGAPFRQSSRSGTVHLLNVIPHLIVDRFLMLCVVSPNPFAAMLLQEGHTVLMPSRSRQLGRAVSSAIQRVHVGSIRYKQLNGVQVSRNRGGVKRGSPFMVVGPCNEDSMQQHRLNCAEIFVVRSIYEQISGTR